MSRFFRGGEDSSSDSSSDEEELYSDEEVQQAVDQNDSDDSDDMEDTDQSEDSSSDDEAGGANRFLRDAASDSESEEEEVRAKVKSAKAKQRDELDASIKQIENGQKNGDWTLISAGTWNCCLYNPRNFAGSFAGSLVLCRGIKFGKPKSNIKPGCKMLFQRRPK